MRKQGTRAIITKGRRRRRRRRHGRKLGWKMHIADSLPFKVTDAHLGLLHPNMTPHR